MVLAIKTVVVIEVEILSTGEKAVVVMVMTKAGVEVSTDGSGAVIIAPVGTSGREVNVRISMEVTGLISGLDAVDTRVGVTLASMSIKLVKVVLSTTNDELIMTLLSFCAAVSSLLQKIILSNHSNTVYLILEQTPKTRQLHNRIISVLVCRTGYPCSVYQDLLCLFNYILTE